MTYDISYTDLLHSNIKLPPKDVQELWDRICKNSDGIDVEKVREELGLSSKYKDIEKIIKGHQFLTKSKLGSRLWDDKQFQCVYMFGIKGLPNQIMREGTNKHLIEELLPEYIDINKLTSLFESTKNITDYIVELSNQIIVDTVSNSVGQNIKDIDSAMSFFALKEEVENYNYAIKMIAYHYQRDFAHLSKIYNYEDAVRYLLPKWREVVIWDNEEFTNGVVDAIQEMPFDRWKPIDYKFGKPKEKYYMPKVELELTFYKELISSQNAEYALEYFGERKPWVPLYSTNGEMWYVLGGDSGILNVDFCSKFDLAYYTAVNDYWKAMDDLTYPVSPTYGYMKNRFDDYCNIKVDNQWKCEFRGICGRSNSFKSENIIQSIGIDDMIDDSLVMTLYNDLLDDEEWFI